MKILYRVSNARVGNPVIPRNEEDPAKQFGNLRNAKAKLRKRIKNIKAGMRRLIGTLDPVLVSTNATATNANVYSYDIDANRYQSINLFIQQLLYEELLDSPQGVLTNRWWLRRNLSIGYEDGTSDALQSSKNMASIDVVGPELSAAMRSIQMEQILFSPGFQRRVGLLHSRVFNNMKGLTDSSKTDLAESLARSMAAGKGIREVTKDVMARVDVTESRAWRIARTETLQAYRSATATETDELNEDVYSDSDWIMEQLWWSALSNTTRRTHARKHGQVLNTEEVRSFYAVDGNSINCLCSQSPILTNTKTGEIIQQELVDKMEERRDKYLAVK